MGVSIKPETQNIPELPGTSRNMKKEKYFPWKKKKKNNNNNNNNSNKIFFVKIKNNVK